MKLIYVNEIGLDYKGQKQYEFIFSETEEFDMDEWFDTPASSTSTNKSPDVEYIDIISLLKDTDLVLELIQNSDYFGVIDSVDGVVAMAWEKTNLESDSERLFFRFGESIESVTKKIKSRGYKLENKNLKFNKHEEN